MVLWIIIKLDKKIIHRIKGGHKNTKYNEHEGPTEFLQLKYYKGLIYGIMDHP